MLEVPHTHQELTQLWQAVQPHPCFVPWCWVTNCQQELCLLSALLYKLETLMSSVWGTAKRLRALRLAPLPPLLAGRQELQQVAFPTSVCKSVWNFLILNFLLWVPESILDATRLQQRQWCAEPSVVPA